MQPRKKSMNFVPPSQRVEISNLRGLVFLKGTLVHQKPVTGVSSCDSERLREVLRNREYRFPIHTRKKSVNFFPANQRVEIPNFIVSFF